MTKTLRIILPLVSILFSLPALAHDFEVPNADGTVIYYKKINDAEVAVTYQGSNYNSFADEYNETVVIPSTVTYSGTKYSVTSIADEAFALCSGLTAVSIPSSVTSIGHNAFRDCNKLRCVYVKSVNPPSCNDNEETFDYYQASNTTLYVPTVSKSAYKQASVWKDFTNIVGIDFPKAYISYENTINFDLSEGQSSVKFYIFRENDQGAVTITISSTAFNAGSVDTCAKDEPANFFSVPTQVSFADGQNKALVTVNFPFEAIETFDNYKLTVKIDGSFPNDYALGQGTFNIFYIPWQPVAGGDGDSMCTFIDPLTTSFVRFSDEVTDEDRTWKCPIEEHPKHPGFYRVAEPYSPKYNVWCDGILSDVYNYVTLPADEVRYLYIHAEDKDFVYFESWWTGWDPVEEWGYGQFFYMNLIQYWLDNGYTLDDLRIHNPDNFGKQTNGHIFVDKSNTRFIDACSFKKGWRSASHDFHILLPGASMDNHFEIRDTETCVGKTARVAVEMKNVEDITAFQCDVYLPEGLTAKMTDGEYDVFLGGRATRTHSISTELQPDGAIRVAASSARSAAFTGYEGTLFTIDVEAPYVPDDYPIVVSNIIISTVEMDETSAPDVSATVSVGYKLGDSNGDGNVTITDAVNVVNYVLGRVPKIFVFKAADVNRSDNITITDAVGTVNIIMGRYSGPTPVVHLHENVSRAAQR